ncbi:phenylacetate--CoA ligase family protein [Endomicrobium proavitum]|uniref:Phenylacetate-coenzyme A ligase n=1 Tax=Endomicrobium proavitum TaxID=1408281 RepID=A0A0G3WFJ8_9BACT|nr:phenylacetate--CoA ligase [Endomicrobium proavitum]AKL97431.1 Phenylacetate-coenzyme A ligase [Endomicrobium proavitum]
MFWQKEIETASRKDLQNFQLKNLNETIERAKKSKIYSKQLKDVRTLTDVKQLQNLPFTQKQDLRDGFPYGFLAADLSDVIRMHSSSGTTGNPTVVFHTKKDLDAWSNISARCMFTAGARKTDIFQNTMGYGLFTGGLGFHYGAEKLGMMVIPIGPGNSQRQIWFMKNFQVSAVHILPSYAVRLYHAMKDAGVNPKTDLNLKIFFIGAEPHTEELRREIEGLYGVKAFNSYGLSEVSGPGIAFECQEQNGMHIWEDYVIPEIIDPETLEVLPDGKEGELVLTTISREAMPVIRYRTRDLTKIISEPCPCGRTHRRIARIKGRTDDMMIINGVNIFPVQIEKTIMGIPEASKNYIIEITKKNYMDKLNIKIEINPETFGGTLEGLENLKSKLKIKLKEETGVSPDISFVDRGALPVSEGKVKRVYDLRDK